MELQQSFKNLTDVSLTLTKHILQNDGKDSNVVFSPLSMQVILSLIAAASKGQTLNELLTFLKAKSSEQLNSLSSYLIDVIFADGSSSGGPILSLSNGIWIDKSLSFKSPFKKVVNHVYKAAYDAVDFKNKPNESANLLNSWVEKETNSLIKDIFPRGAVDKLTWLVYANAIYFKGEWLNPFKVSDTKDYDFHLLDGSSIQVPFITISRADRQYICAFDTFKVLTLHYKQGNDKQRKFSMNIFLPKAKDGLPTLVEKLGSEPGFLDQYIASRTILAGKVWIPKFKISSGKTRKIFVTSKNLRLQIFFFLQIWACVSHVV